MPHSPKPFFKANRNTWYVEVDRVQHPLGKHPDGTPPPVKKHGVWQAPPEIMAAFYKKMAAAPEPLPVSPSAVASGELVVAVLDQFLEWCQKHKAHLTYVWYRDRTQWFARTIPKHLPVAELRPIHVERWVDAHPNWSPSHQRGCKIAVQRAFHWAEKMGIIDRNPIRFLEKPQAGKREQVISPEQYEELLGHFSDEEFSDLLAMAWHTGARPQETIRIEARHFDQPNRRVVLPPKEAKGKKRYRIIYLNDDSLELLRRRVERHPSGRLFRNEDGNPWTAWAVNSRFCRFQQNLGKRLLKDGGFSLDAKEVHALAATLKPTRTVDGKAVEKGEKERIQEARKKLLNREAAKRGAKYCLYAFRHTFANRLLEAGIDSLTVSTLLGHVDGTMLSRVYSHLQQKADHLLDAVNRVTTGAGV